jgi:hypothetical protein
MKKLAELLFRGESASLDFKRDQYPFSGCDDATKAELLKDILAMVNSWRSEPAYILIGVDDSVSPPKVVGVKDHPDDAMLQQFVHGKTQRQAKFAYYSADLEGCSIGVIEIPVQTRPVYLRKDYGGLKANCVYLRRGSSTGFASPDEIAQMGADASSLRESDLDVRFAKTGSHKLEGKTFSLECQAIVVDKESDLPDFGDEEPTGFYASTFHVRGTPNREFYRELVNCMKDFCLLRPASLTISNNGAIPAKEIRVEFSFPDPERKWEFREAHEVDFNLPKRYRHMHEMVSMDAVQPISRKGDPNCDIRYLDGTWHLTFEFGHLQPGRTLWPALEFFTGARQTDSIQLEGRIMADGLPAATSCLLEFKAQVENTAMDLSDLVERYDEQMRKGQV